MLSNSKKFGLYNFLTSDFCTLRKIFLFSGNTTHTGAVSSPKTYAWPCVNCVAVFKNSRIETSRRVKNPPNPYRVKFYSWDIDKCEKCEAEQPPKLFINDKMLTFSERMKNENCFNLN